MKMYIKINSSFFSFLYLAFILNGHAIKIHTEITSNINNEGKIASSVTSFKSKVLVPIRSD
jgi:hypothetical protein